MKGTFFTDPDEERADERSQHNSSIMEKGGTVQGLSGTDTTTSSFMSKGFQTAASPFSWQNNKTKMNAIFNPLAHDTLFKTGTAENNASKSSGEFKNETSPTKEMSISDGSSSTKTLTRSQVTKEMNARSFYETFKILSLLFFLMFAPLIIMLFTDISCMDSSNYCIPHFEMYLDHKGKDEVINTDFYHNIAKGLHILSSQMEDGPYPTEQFMDSISEISDKVDVIYKFNLFGYCRQEKETEITSYDQPEWLEICHSLFGATDLSSVFVKDITFQMEYAQDVDVEGLEKSSNEIVSSFKSLFLRAHSSSNPLVRHVSLGLSFSLMFVILKIVRFSLNAAALLIVFLAILQIKQRKQQSKTNVKTLSIAASCCLILSAAIEVLSLIFEHAYHEELKAMLDRLDYNVIHHFNYFTSGTVLKFISLSFEGVIILGILLFISAKPWLTRTTLFQV